MPELPSPSGPWPPKSDGVASSIADIDKAIESLNREGRAAQEKATKLLELEHAKEVLKQQYVRSAAVVTGQLPSVASKGGQDIKIEGALSSQREKREAKQVQSATAAVAAVVNLLWLTYFGEDAPPELYVAVAAALPFLTQFGTAQFLNREKK